MTPKYYESHVTIDPTDKLDKLKFISGAFGFKLAKLYLDKVSDLDQFMTAHGTEFAEISARMDNLVLTLKDNGFNVRRYKIEAVLVDSRDYINKSSDKPV